MGGHWRGDWADRGGSRELAVGWGGVDDGLDEAPGPDDEARQGSAGCAVELQDGGAGRKGEDSGKQWAVLLRRARVEAGIATWCRHVIGGCRRDRLPTGMHHANLGCWDALGLEVGRRGAGRLLSASNGITSKHAGMQRRKASLTSYPTRNHNSSSNTPGKQRGRQRCAGRLASSLATDGQELLLLAEVQRVAPNFGSGV